MTKSTLLHAERTIIRGRVVHVAVGLGAGLLALYLLAPSARLNLMMVAISLGLVLLPVWAELQIKIHNYLEPSLKQSAAFRHNTAKALRTVLTAAYALGFLTLIGGITLLTFNIGPAITPAQIALIGFLLIPAITATLLWDTPDTKRIKQAWRDRLTGRSAALDFIGFGLVAAGLSYGNFLYFFSRNDISPSFMAMDTPLFLQATTVAWVTLTVCLVIQLFFERINTHEEIMSEYLIKNQPLLIGTAGLLVVISLAIYVPLLASITRSAPLGFVDWLMILLAGISFFAIRLVQRHTRQHSRHLVVALHREIHG